MAFAFSSIPSRKINLGIKHADHTDTTVLTVYKYGYLNVITKSQIITNHMAGTVIEVLFYFMF